MSRSAGTIFSGTVLNVETQPAGKQGPIPLIVVRFRVDRAIAGVRPGQVLTVREWAGAWSMHRVMREGQRLLIFLYPASRLGLTSPVGGPQGQVVLGSSGEIVRTSAAGVSAAFAARLKSCSPENLTGVGFFPGDGDLPQGQCGSENSVVPPGLESFLPVSPALKRWAKLERPSGAGLSENSFLSLARKSESSFPSLARERVLAPALKRCSTQNLAFSANCNAHFQNGLNAALKRCSTQDPTLLAECTASTPPVITLRQLARAIRSVRRDASAASARSKE